MLNIEKVGWCEEESHLDWISLVKINLEPRSLFDEAEGEIWSSEKIQFFWLARLWANDESVVSSERYGVGTKGHSLQNFQFCSNKYFHWRSSFPSQYKLKNHFYLIFKDFLKLSLGVSKDVWKGFKKNYRTELTALARAMIIRFKQEPILNKLLRWIWCYKHNNNKLVGSYLRCTYNHVLLEKTSRLYQICCLTSRKMAAILRIYFQHTLFPRLSHSWQAITCTNRIWQNLAFGFINKRSGY